ncbi:MAG TPA: PqqD family protein [Terriglobales bacterium]|nr:PqqD family protein [Terriglobales bacterium]
MAFQKSSPWRPKAIKREDWFFEETGGEMLVYNLERHRVHCLNDNAVLIWKLCTGRRTVSQIAAELPMALHPRSRELVVRNTIGQLARLGLIEANDDVPKISRRELAKRIGIGTAAAVALPLVTTIVAPTPVYAASCGSIPCHSTPNCPPTCGTCNNPPGGPPTGICNPGGPCWIAAAVYGGWLDPRTVWIRRWLVEDYERTAVGRVVVGLYRKFGRRVAERVKKSSILKRGFRVLFDLALKKAEARYGAIPPEVAVS